jgi:hypothetical protein
MIVPDDSCRSASTMHVNRRYVFAVVAVWEALAALSIISGTPAPAFLNHSDRTDYGCCEPTVAGDTWLRVCGKSSSDGYTLPLIYCSETSGPPISLAVSALDYRNDAIDYTHMDVESVVVTVEGCPTELTIPPESKRIAFRAHYSGAIANCLLRLPNNLQPATDVEMFVTVTVAVSTGERTDRYTISGALRQSRWSGYWLIFEAFAPHT